MSASKLLMDLDFIKRLASKVPIFFLICRMLTLKKIDFYNMLLTDPKRDRNHPPHLQSYMEDTRQVMFHVRDVIQRKMLVLLAMCLEIPEDQMLATHAPGKSSSEYYRYVSLLDWVV